MKTLTKDILPQLEGPIKTVQQDQLPEKILQFGEGNFLRGFFDWMLQQLNKEGLFQVRVVAIQPTPHGKVVPKINAQDGLYTSVLRGIKDEVIIEEYEVISVISRGINPYTNWQDVLDVAISPQIECVTSNTTEAGLTYLEEEYDGKTAPLSFPGKLAACLYARYQALNGSPESGWTIIPCELVENNGQVLKELVIRMSKEWGFSEEFLQWVREHNQFCETLVDRIVTGYPADSIADYRERLGYDDRLLTVGEPYHLFVINGGSTIREALPFHEVGLNVKWGDVKPYRDLKVRLLNGPHTMMFAVSYLAGADTVLEAMEAPELRAFINQGIERELYPLVKIDEQEKKEFVTAVIERFLNPYNKHYLTDIGMNAVYKFKTRLLPSLLEFVEKHKSLPQSITLSLAALFMYYRPKRRDGAFLVGKRGSAEYQIRDQDEVLQLFEAEWKKVETEQQSLQQLVKNLLSKEALWGLNLCEVPELEKQITAYLNVIDERGMRQAIIEQLT